MRITLGTDRRGRRLGIRLYKIRHLATFGGSGTGKSFHLLHAISEVMKLHLRGIRIALIVIDPHGSLFRHALTLVQRFGLGDRTIVFNPTATWTPCLNPIVPPYDDVDIPSMVAHAIHRAVQDKDEAVMARVRKYLHASVQVLQETGHTLVEAFELIGDADVRAHLLDGVRDYYALTEWRRFDETPDFHKVQRIESTESRISHLVCSARTMRRILGNTRSTISMHEVLQRGLIFLVNLDSLTHEQRCMVGALLTDNLFTAAGHRRPDTGYHALALIDEAADYMADNKDLSKILDTVRKRRLHVWACLQHISAVQEANPLLYSSMLTNCDVKMVFGGSRQDSEQLVGEIFHDLARDEVRQELFHRIVRHVEETRTIHGRTRGTARSEGSTAAGGAGTGNACTYDPVSMLPTFTWSDSGFDSSSQSHARSDIDLESETVVPFLKPVEDLELAQRELRSVEQLREQRIAWLQAQPDRHFWAALGRAAPPVALRTPDVHAPRVPDHILERFLEHLYVRHGCQIRAELVDRQIEARRITLRPQVVVLADVERSDPAPCALPAPTSTQMVLEAGKKKLAASTRKRTQRKGGEKNAAA